MDENNNFSKILIGWYLENLRDLPWRQTKNPYRIWVSEIILQQTRVNQGIGYFDRFINQFPDIYSLANAKDDEVMKAWEGLGYYSRARNMLETARFIANHLQGRFPENHHELSKLKGIGQYTAAAIASIAFDEPVAVVDGNVSRLLSRHFGISQPLNTASGIKILRQIANRLMDKSQPGIFNQAMMEFGALQCVPINPDCSACSFRQTCFAFSQNRIKELPKRNNKPKPSSRYFNYILFVAPDKSVIIKQRTGKDIWINLYDLPLIEANELLTRDKLKNYLQFSEYISMASGDKEITTKDYRHILTHQVIQARFFKIQFNNNDDIGGNGFLKASQHELKKYPFPRLITKYLIEEGLINVDI